MLLNHSAMLAQRKNMADSGEPVAKKQKVEEYDEVKKDLKNFQIVNVLKEDTAKRLLVVEGRIQGSSDETGNENKAVLFLERNPISIEHAKELVLSDNINISFHNDCYNSILLAPSKSSYDVKGTFINPATDFHITKYTYQECFVVHETPEIYQEITLPNLEKEAHRIQWVYNILDKKSEKEKILYEDPDPEKGYILLPDLKWNGIDIDSLYLVVIIHKRNLKSIRELNQSHLPLLKSILTKCPIILQKKYGLPPHKLRIYCHYRPSYPHFHVHINNIKLDCPAKDVHAAHLLSDIIQNIQLKSTYYLDRTITYQVKQKTLLFEQLKSAGYIEGLEENNLCEVKDLDAEPKK